MKWLISFWYFWQSVSSCFIWFYREVASSFVCSSFEIFSCSLAFASFSFSVFLFALSRCVSCWVAAFSIRLFRDLSSDSSWRTLMVSFLRLSISSLCLACSSFCFFRRFSISCVYCSWRAFRELDYAASDVSSLIFWSFVIAMLLILLSSSYAIWLLDWTSLSSSSSDLILWLS